MMKKTAFILTLLISLLIFSSCDVQKVQNNQGNLKVYTSFYPMYDFAKKVGGDKIDLVNIVPAGTEPHNWEPSSTDIVNLQNADVFIYSGAGMESWVDKVINSVNNKKLVVVEASKGISLIEENDDSDPHVWTSIVNAKKQMENIKDALTNADPENAEYYLQNYELYSEKFDQLDDQYRDIIGNLENNSIVVAHQAFSYMCKEYGLNQVAIEGLSAESEPDPMTMSKIISFAKQNEVNTIFFEELVSPKVAQTIAAELGAKTDILNPLEGLTQEQLDNGEDYLSIMKKNLEALYEALK